VSDTLRYGRITDTKMGIMVSLLDVYELKGRDLRKETW
jgi:hypothetical protein